MADTRGYSLVEVMVALVLLGMSMLSVQAMITDRLVTTVGREDRVAVANQLAKDRVAQIELEPSYFTLEERYSGTENPVPGHAGFVRSTRITRNGTPNTTGEYKTVTVRVWSPDRPDTLARTTVVGAP